MFEHINHAVVKVTRDCNLRCKYCYVADKDKYKNEVMSFDVFKDLVNRIIKDRIKNNTYREEFNFTFHGGEPTIIGYDTLNKYLSSPLSIENSISNLSPLFIRISLSIIFIYNHFPFYDILFHINTAIYGGKLLCG